ncbi:MAG: radical SAM protein [Desulfobacterales bacterium]|nr:radical SAM protein [Desulfobacterales bacterium]
MATPKRPYIVPVFIPHAGCPHRCAFCNQTAITLSAMSLPSVQRIRERIDRHLAYPRDPDRPVEIAFFGGNFLGLDPPAIGSLLSEAGRYVETGKVGAIRFSTRPETVTARRLDRIHGLGVGTIEIGAQSMNDQVLAAAGRGHTADHTRKAVAHLKQRGYETGLQMMVGLPGQSPEDAMDTGRQLAALEPDLVRIYPTVVLRGSRLAHWYATGRYRPMSLADSVSLVKSLYTMFCDHGIAVTRMGLQGSEAFEASGDIVCGPYHPAFGHLVHAERFLDMAVKTLEGHDIQAGAVTLAVNPRNLSRLRGQNNANVRQLKERFGIDRLTIKTNPSLPADLVSVVG